MNIWRCFSDDDSDEYNEDQEEILQQIRQLQQQLEQGKRAMEIQREERSTNEEQIQNSLNKFLDLLVGNLL